MCITPAAHVSTSPFAQHEACLFTYVHASLSTIALHDACMHISGASSSATCLSYDPQSNPNVDLTMVLYRSCAALQAGITTHTLTSPMPARSVSCQNHPMPQEPSAIRQVCLSI